MPLRVSGRNISVGAVLQRKITDRVEEAASKYFRGGYSGHATIGKEGFGFRTEFILHLDSGALLEAEGMAADAYDSAEQAAIRIEKRLRRYKRRRKDHQHKKNKCEPFEPHCDCVFAGWFRKLVDPIEKSLHIRQSIAKHRTLWKALSIPLLFD